MVTEMVDAKNGVILELYPDRREVAAELKEYMDAKPKKVFFNKLRYPEYDDWQLIGSKYGITCKTFDPKFVEINGFKGFHAKALLLDDKLNEVGRAEAFCMDDEPNWRNKPIFSLASQAQTRAACKAFSNRFRPVVRTAGYETTSAEELDGILSDTVEKPRSPGYPPKTEALPPSNGPVEDIGWPSSPEDVKVTASQTITEKQAKFLFFKWKEAGHTPEQLKAHLGAQYKLEHTKDLTKAQLQTTLDLLESEKK